MTILCIESSTSVCSAAISKDGVPVKQCICLEGSNHARLLPRYIEELLALSREQGLSIEGVGLSEGPGSYTGLRIGASTAKGLCYGLNVPLYPVSTLEVLCTAAREKLRAEGVDLTNAVLIPMIDARRMEVYTNVQSDHVQGTKEKARAVVVENEESLVGVQRDYVQCAKDNLQGTKEEAKEYYYFGDGAEKCSKLFTKPNWHYLPGVVPDALTVASTVGLPSADRREQSQIAYYEPFYLKDFIAAPSHVKGLK